MENYIYIIIGILWVAYSLYTARQKAIQKEQSAGNPPSGPSQSSPLPIPGGQGGGKSVFEELIRELTGEPRPVPQYKPVATYDVEEAVSLETIGKPKSSTSYISIPEMQANMSAKSHQTSNEMSDNTPTKAKNEGLAKNFDLREAVIFSELLNRKYF